MTDLESFLEEDHTDKSPETFFYEYSQVDDTFVDIESEGEVTQTVIPMLPAQIELMEDTTTKILGYFGGFGSGVWWGFFY